MPWLLYADKKVPPSWWSWGFLIAEVAPMAKSFHLLEKDKEPEVTFFYKLKFPGRGDNDENLFSNVNDKTFQRKPIHSTTNCSIDQEKWEAT